MCASSPAPRRRRAATHGEAGDARPRAVQNGKDTTRFYVCGRPQSTAFRFSQGRPGYNRGCWRPHVPSSSRRPCHHDSDACRRPGPRPVEVSRRAPRRHRRDAPRPRGARPVSLARRPEQRRDQGLGRGREPRHVRLSRADPGAREDQGAAHAALELRALRHAVARGRLVHLRQERRPAEPVGHLQDQGARRAGRDPDRPQLAVERRHRRPRQPLVQRRRQVPGVLAVGERIGLARMARARRRDGRATCPTSSSGASSAAPPGSRTARASSTAATTRRKKARPSPA